MPAYEQYEVTRDFVHIKFDETVAVSTLINANFTLYDDAATPSAIANPFKNIELAKDWISTSRWLALWWNDGILQTGETYTIVADNLKTPFGTDLLGMPMEITFTVDESWNIPEVDGHIPEHDGIADIEDWTINYPTWPTEVTGTTSTSSSSAFKVVEVTPNFDSSYHLDALENHGKISIEFTQLPASNFINSSDFKLQKKKIARGITKWEIVDTLVAAESGEPIVHIYLPSQDATPVYSFMTNEEKEYWEPGYKYRLILDKQIGF